MKFVRIHSTGHEAVACPHCGGMNISIEAIRLNKMRWFVRCDTCGATGPAMPGGQDDPDRTGLGPDLAVKAWNGFIPGIRLKSLVA